MSHVGYLLMIAGGGNLIPKLLVEWFWVDFPTFENELYIKFL